MCTKSRIRKCIPPHILTGSSRHSCLFCYYLWMSRSYVAVLSPSDTGKVSNGPADLAKSTSKTQKSGSEGEKVGPNHEENHDRQASPLAIAEWDPGNILSLASDAFARSNSLENLCIPEDLKEPDLQGGCVPRDMKETDCSNQSSLCATSKLEYRLPGSPAPGEEIQSLEMCINFTQVQFPQSQKGDLHCMTLSHHWKIKSGLLN